MSQRDAVNFTEFFRYHGLWAPGVRLFRRLRFLGKAAVIFAVFLLVLSPLAIVFVRSTQAEIAKSERELAGLAVQHDLLALFEAAQGVRGGLYAAGGKAIAPVATAIDDLDARLAALEKRPEAQVLGLGDSFKFARQAFGPLRTAAADGEEAFGRADDFVQQLLRLSAEVADRSGLSMDPEEAAFELAIASTRDVLEVAAMVGRVQDLGVQAIEKKEASGFAKRIVQGDTYVLYKQVEKLFARYERVAKSDEQLEKALAFAPAFDPVNAFMRSVRKSVLPESGPRGEARDFASSGAAALQSLGALTGRSHAAIGELVRARVASLQAQRNLQLALLAVGLTLAAYLFYCFYLVTRGGMNELTRHIDALARGDLTTTPRPWGADEAADVMTSVNAMQESLRRLVGEVRACADDIVGASAEVASGADDLSQRTERSAGRLQQTASTMESIARTVHDTARKVGESAQLGQDTSRAAGQSQSVIGDVVSTMRGIQESSRRVADILGVIDGIAFQTNILALNAAVEAARAGEHGRGFAVVAGEVRALAQRSASAAREIKSLIAESTGQTEHGTRIVHAAGERMSELLDNVAAISCMLDQVHGATEQQTQGVEQVSRSVAQLDEDTQRNAALVEQTSASALSMKAKAEQLAAAASRFVLPQGA